MKRREVVIAVVAALLVIAIGGCNCKATKEEVEEGSESWAEWAKDKISEGLGYKGPVEDAAIDAAKNTKHKITDTATGSGECAGEMSKGAGEEAKVKASEAYEKGTEAVKRAGEEASDKAGWAKERAREGYDAAKERAGEAYESTKDGIASNVEAAKDGIASNVEAAKEKTQNVVNQRHDHEL